MEVECHSGEGDGDEAGEEGGDAGHADGGEEDGGGGAFGEGCGCGVGWGIGEDGEWRLVGSDGLLEEGGCWCGGRGRGRLELDACASHGFGLRHVGGIQIVIAELVIERRLFEEPGALSGSLDGSVNPLVGEGGKHGETEGGYR